MALQEITKIILISVCKYQKCSYLCLTKTKQTMKTVVIKNYIQGLSSFLDEQNIKWEPAYSKGEEIRIFFETEEQLFRLGFEFGKFYEAIATTHD